MSKATLAIVIVILLTALPAIQQGRLMNRWGEPPNLGAAGSRLHEFPRQMGHWRSGPDQKPLSQPVCEELGLVEHFRRQYAHDKTGEQIEVLLMVGTPGKLVRHPPDVCYANRANQQLGDTVPLEFASKSTTQQFKVLHFKRAKLPMESDFLVAYAFTTGSGAWLAPTSPRMEFGAEPLLYKLQVLSESTGQAGMKQLEEFLTDFVDAFPSVLVSESKEASGTL